MLNGYYKINIYWYALIKWIKDRMLEEENVSPEDLEIFNLVDTVEEAVGVIDDFYKKYDLKPNF